ncbi:MAG: DNA cytosine methyltransferase [Nitrospira sp.]|nr:MAG: DNA cytosine methyltransferase [Nitrospira sp.]
MKEYTFIDLFSGAGGLAEGFRQAGFRSVYGVELEAAAAATYNLNFGHDVYQGPIEKLNNVPVNADIVIGGPPCQGFSPLGLMSPREAHAQMNELWRHYLRITREVKPIAFVMENVPEILRSVQYPKIKRAFEKLGFIVTEGVLNAADFYVPQARRRAFVIGIRRGFHEPELPQPSGKKVTVRDAIGDLPLQPTGQNWHIGRNPTQKSVLRYKCVPPGGNRFDLVRKRPDLAPNCWIRKRTGSTDVFGRLEWDKTALTIRTEFFKPEKGRYLHPEAHRPITHREAARLQTFPDSFIFLGSKIEVARQIGNAVPPMLARAVAEALRRSLQKK